MTNDTQFSSILLGNAVKEFSKLPGIGKRTALRLSLHLLRQSKEDVENFGNTFIALRNEIQYCNVCHNISDTEVCQICADTRRDATTVCVVENIRGKKITYNVACAYLVRFLNCALHQLVICNGSKRALKTVLYGKICSGGRALTDNYIAELNRVSHAADRADTHYIFDSEKVIKLV